MPRGREYIGLAVRAASTGELVAHISDLVIDPGGRVVAFMLQPSKGLLRKERLLPSHAITHISREGAWILHSDVLDEVHEPPQGWRLLAKNDGLCGRRLIDTEGRLIGIVGDVIVSDHPVSVWGFEVSDGIVKDLLDGRPIVDGTGAVMRDGDIVLSHLPHMNLEESGHATLEGSD